MIQKCMIKKSSLNAWRGGAHVRRYRRTKNTIFENMHGVAEAVQEDTFVQKSLDFFLTNESHFFVEKMHGVAAYRNTTMTILEKCLD